jgi:exopolysaccharide biosynthesis polyprenyl glycosylphosphotransferase
MATETTSPGGALVDRAAQGGIDRSLSGLLGEISVDRRHNDQIRARDATYRRALAGADVTAALAGLLLAVAVSGTGSLHWRAVVIAPVLILVAKVIGLYDHDNLVLRKATLDEAPVLFEMATLYALVVWLLDGFVLQNGHFTHAEALAVWGFVFVLLLTGRSAGRALLRRMTSVERCMLVGDEVMWEKLTQSISHRRGVELVSRLALRTPQNGRGKSLNIEIAGALNRLRDQVQRDGAHRVIISLQESGFDEILDCIFLLRRLGVKVSVVPKLLEVVGSAVEFEDIDGMPVLGIRNFGLTRSSAFVKHSFDLAAGVLALIFAAPLFLAIAIAIKFDSRGKVLFRQPRVGRDGRIFRMYKFRTMNPGADELRTTLEDVNETTGIFKIADDPRITRVGRLLRHTSLDELPQLLNVVKGDMSLVGPRPLVPEEDRKVEGWARRRLHLTPGMTGNWQTLGAQRVPLHEMVKIDYLYIANWSLWGDIKALLRTVPHVFGRRGL